jgi:uracil-DNA glycosylase
MLQEERKSFNVQIETSWKEVLKEEFEKAYMHELSNFLKDEREHHVVYPPKKDVFRAFELCPYPQLKVVIIGQDPYHNPNQAHGLCFSVQEGVKPPPSLVNIYKEIKNDLGVGPFQTGCLEPWARQGILLLNATLTVRAHLPKSHYGMGWERFTDAVCQKVAEKTEPIVFVLWGRSAQEKFAHIQHPDTRHLVLKAAHPSPYSATQFFGCRHFSKINQFLKAHNRDTVNWQL